MGATESLETQAVRMVSGHESLSTPGVRSTKQRAAVERLLLETQEFRSAQQLHELLRGRGDRIGLTTVYRTLQALGDAGLVDSIVGADGETTYRRCSAHHHHHLVCRACGSTVEIDGPVVETWALTVAADHGFTAVDHTVEIVGICSTCATLA